MNRNLAPILALMLLAASCGPSTPDKKDPSVDPADMGMNDDAGPTEDIQPSNSQNNLDCVFDSDCLAGEACEEQLCVATCDVDADCAVGEFCREGTTTAANVCKSTPPLNNIGNTNNSNTNNSSTNNVPGELYYVVQVTSTTTDAGACQDVSDPGPDIFGVALEDETGTVLGWGAAVLDDIEIDGNDQANFDILDGNPPDLNADICPDGFDGNVVSLGCPGVFGAYVAVEFIDADGLPVPINAEPDRSVRVYEWGGQCSTGAFVDTYNVDVCTDTNAVKNDFDVSSCTVQVLVDAAGEAVATIPTL